MAHQGLIGVLNVAFGVTIVGLYSREDATWLAEVLTETESDPDDLARIQLIEAIRRAVS